MIRLKRIKMKYIVVTIFFVIEIIPDFRTSSLFWWGCIALLTGMYIWDNISVLGKPLIRINKYEKWILPFYGFAIASIIWAQNKEFVFTYIPTLLVTALIVIELSQMIHNEEDLDAFMRARFIATAVLTVYIFINIDIKELGNERIGSSVLGSGWNSNEVALKLTVGCMLGMQEIKHERNKFVKLVSLGIVLGMVTIMMLCGSRTAFIMTVFGICINVWLTAQNKRLIVTLSVVLVVLIFINIVMTVPELYDILGYRLLKIEDGVRGTAEQGSGTALRFLMIEKGGMFFLQKPLWGYGMNNFRQVFGDLIGIYYYAHNNHIEIIVDFGLIGIMLYYSGYYYIIKEGLRGFKQRKLNRHQIFAVGTALTLLLAGMGAVTYMNTSEQILLALCYTGLEAKSRLVNVKRNGSGG